jgi:deoxyadenosine/deoxycytidine kinase
LPITPHTQDAQNPFLERFYRNQKSGALPAQLFFLFQRAQQLGTLKQQDLFAPRRVADYLFEKDRLFAGLTLDSAEMALYEQVASRLAVDPPKPDLVVYLQAPVETLLQRIAKRGISYESGIDAAYLTRLNDAYARFFHEFDQAPLLIVNAANIDPVQNQADYDELVGAIQRMKKGRMYYNPLRHSTI